MKFTVAIDGTVDVGRNGTREDVPTQVVGWKVCLDQFGVIKEGGRGCIDWIDVYDNNEVNRGVWVKSGLK